MGSGSIRKLVGHGRDNGTECRESKIGLRYGQFTPAIPIPICFFTFALTDVAEAINGHDPKDPTSLSPETRERLQDRLNKIKNSRSLRIGIPQVCTILALLTNLANRIVL